MLAGLFLDILGGLMRSSPRAAILENPSFSLSDPKAWEETLGGHLSEAGERINYRRALTVASVWQAISMISGDIAVMPLSVYRKMPDGDQAVDDAHPAQYLVNVQPNVEAGAFEYWRRLMAHALLWQSGFAYIERAGPSPDARPIGLYNLLPDRTSPARDPATGQLVYLTEVNGRKEVLFAWEVLHVRGLSMDGGKGCSLIDKARNAIGLALAAENFPSKFFAAGAQAAGVLEVPPSWQEKAVKNLEEGWRHKYNGKDNWFKVAILRDGAKFHSTMIDAQKSQTHELREDQVRELARFFNLPPGKLGLADSVSYNSAEQMQLTYLGSCLNHWRAAIACECRLKLTTEQQRRQNSHCFRHDVTALLEIDIKTLNDVLAVQRQNEVINANEWRRTIGRPKRTDPGGDVYQNPNTKSGSPAGAPADDNPPPPRPPVPPKRNTRAARRARASLPVFAGLDADEAAALSELPPALAARLLQYGAGGSH